MIDCFTQALKGVVEMPFDVPRLLSNILYIVVISLVCFLIYYLINIGNKKVNRNNRIILDLSSVKRTAVIISLILLTLYLFNRYKILIDTVVTIIIALILAYLINPLVKRLEKRGIKRSWAILIVYLGVVALFAVLGLILIPQTARQIRDFLVQLPTLINDTLLWINNLNENLFSKNAMMNTFAAQITEEVKNAFLNMQSKALEGFTDISNSASGIISNIVRIVLAPILCFYFILDKEKIIHNIRGLIPVKSRAKVNNIFLDIDNVNSNFVRGRLIMAFFVGVLTTILLFIMGIDFALVIGIITFVADIIPYIGPFLGFLPAFVLALMDNPIKAVWVGVFFVIIQWAENNILAPRVLSVSIGMNPILILLSLVIGGGMFGVPGMVLSVPVVATGKVIFKHIKPNLKEFFTRDEEEETDSTL